MSLSGKQALATPLTRSTKAGSQYFRPPEVESRLEELLGASSDEQLARARIADYGSSQYVPNECLVYLIRDAFLAGNSERYHVLAASLLKRNTRAIRGKLKLLGVAEDDVEDVHQDLVLAMMTSILEGSKGEYYQIRFKHALRRELAKIYDGYLRRRRRTRDDRSLDSSDDKGNGGEARTTLGEMIESGEDIAIDLEQRLLISEALEAIPNPDHRKAFVLHYAEGWHIGPTDADEQTLSDLFGRTPRMIRNWLRIAERQLADWRAAKRVSVD
jgi:RNA polymerase sigma factor (sigma-70 family)